MNEIPKKIILFDGVCGFCDRSIRFIIHKDKKHKFHFASLQSCVGKKTLNTLALSTSNLSTLVYIDGNKLYTKSSAVIKIMSELGGVWHITILFFIYPKKNKR